MGMDSSPVDCRVSGAGACVCAGGLEQATRAPSRRQMNSIRTKFRTHVLRRLLSPHSLLAVEYRFKCGLRFFRQVVRLSVTRELV